MYAELEIALHRTQAETYSLSLRYTRPDSDADTAPLQGTAVFDFAALRALELDPRAYGEALSAALWQSPEAARFYAQVKSSVESADLLLRLRLFIGPDAPELHALRWELLYEPEGGPIRFSEKILFSRYISGADWRPIHLRAKDELRALIAVAGGTNLDDYGLAPVDVSGEIQRARAGLGDISVDSLGENQSLTLNTLLKSLCDRQPDILYLAAHGRLNKKTGKALLYLQDDDAEVEVVKGADFAQRLCERPCLPHLPRLIVLASCESAGTGETGNTLSAALAPLLNQAGVPAILAMQGKISMKTIEKFLPEFFRELSKDGQIDRALAVARGMVRERPDAWMPALFLRLKDGCLWLDKEEDTQPASQIGGDYIGGDSSNQTIDGNDNIFAGGDVTLNTYNQFPDSRPSVAPPFILQQRELANFTGRHEQLDQLSALLAQAPGAKISTIVGLSGSGGIGKSALAAYFAQEHRERFPDGIIGLRVDEKDAATLAREFARYLGEEIDPDSGESAAGIMQRLFAQRRMLLIFDNADQVDYGLLRDLLPGGKCAVIITTRDRGLPSALGLRGETCIDLPELAETESLELLEKYLDAQRLAGEREEARELAALLGHLPLALKIAGTLLRQRPGKKLADYSTALRAEKLKLRKDAALDLFACFALSLEELEAEEERLFACLSVCARNGFSVDTAAAAGGLDTTEVEDCLFALHQFSLINYAEEQEGLYAFHGLLYEFAKYQALQQSLTEQATIHHAQYFIHQVKIHARPDADGTVLAPLARELAGVVAAAHWLGQEQITDYEFIRKAQVLFLRYGYWNEAKALLDSFRELAIVQQNWKQVVYLQIQIAVYLSLQGDAKAAEALLNDTHRFSSNITPVSVRQYHEAILLDELGAVYQRQGRLQEATESLQKATDIAEKADDLALSSKVLNSLSSMLRRTGRFAEAIDACKKSLALAEQLNDLTRQSKALNSLGMVLQKLGHAEEALDTFQRSLTIAEQLNDEYNMAIGLNSLGGLLQRMNRHEEALEAFQRSLAIAEKLNDEKSMAIGLNSLGGLLQRQNRHEEALAAFQRSLAIAEKLNDENNIAIQLNSLGGVLQRLKRPEEALQAFQRSLAIVEKLNDENNIAIQLNSLGGVLQRLNRLKEALEAFQRSLAIAEKLNDENNIAIQLNSLGGV
ncbi:MAG: tetratricopeptide repeat protein, partial [Gammaproteobacteria bacterium]|nr:tetratricopeptide repeat protein [Gammaproteobacteria bacterium]